jgi:glycosyltransferase involved in cell wall biosynthesis
MMSNPKVSIGMPVYNGEEFIREALDSLLAQTFDDFELIISDNNSSDLTQEICLEYATKDNRIKYIRQSQNVGAILNFNAVLQKASGLYFMWAADDDFWRPSFIEKCLNFLEQNQDYNIVFSKYDVLGRKGGFFLSLYSFPDYSFLQSHNQFYRVSAYVLLNQWRSHKANFIYGLWRTEFARYTMQHFIDIPEPYNYNNQDLGIMVFAVAKTQIFQLPVKLFSKKYRTVAPGSIFILLYYWLIFNFDINKWTNFYVLKMKGLRGEMLALEYALKKANIYCDQYEKVVLLKVVLTIFPLGLSHLVYLLVMFFVIKDWQRVLKNI